MHQWRVCHHFSPPSHILSSVLLLDGKRILITIVLSFHIVFPSSPLPFPTPFSCHTALLLTPPWIVVFFFSFASLSPSIITILSPSPFSVTRSHFFSTAPPLRNGGHGCASGTHLSYAVHIVPVVYTKTMEYQYHFIVTNEQSQTLIRTGIVTRAYRHGHTHPSATHFFASHAPAYITSLSLTACSSWQCFLPQYCIICLH